MQQKIIDHIRSAYDGISFKASDVYRWDPEKELVEYVENEVDNLESALLLLHEIGHAQLKHQDFTSDLDLLRKEVEAWQKAEMLADDIGLKFIHKIAESCLDTYRHWIDKRSTCPSCSYTGYQDSKCHYNCLNCGRKWKVTKSQATRVCRIVVA